jgi:UPF0176 protein
LQLLNAERLADSADTSSKKAVLNIEDLQIKRSSSHIPPFTDFIVKIRPEIVTLGRPDLDVQKESQGLALQDLEAATEKSSGARNSASPTHLSPSQWREAMQDPEALLVDTRNWYEYEIGTFRGALNPKIEQFTEFPEYAEKNLPKDKRLLIFCTGGIRCEKGIFELQQRGFNNVQQLQGGILKFLEEFPDDAFEGECFVFDQRVAVQQNLQPTETYKFCPHCGQPAKNLIPCARCDQHQKLCDLCLKLEFEGQTCSKNCAHHFQLNPGKKGKVQIPAWKQTSEPTERGIA